jgi:hypothetical protein
LRVGQNSDYRGQMERGPNPPRILDAIEILPSVICPPFPG